MKLDKKLTIIITAFNASNFIGECLKSVCNQYNSKIEIIIINDGSTDSTHQIITDYKKRFNFIKYINNKKNKGIGKTRNEGINLARGEYIFFIDSDDAIRKNAIKVYLKNIFKFSETEIFFLNFITDSKYKILFKKKNTKSFEPSHLTTWQYLFKKSFLELNNLHFLNSRTHEDMLLITKCILLSKKTRLIKFPFYIWRKVNSNSLGRKLGLKSIKPLTQSIISLNKIIKNEKFEKFKLNFAKKVITYFTNIIFESVLILDKKKIIKLKGYFDKIGIYKKANILADKKKRFFNNILQKVNKSNVIIFCASRFSSVIISNLLNLKCNIKFVVDSHKKYKGQKLNGINIVDLKYLKFYTKNFKNFKVLVCNPLVSALNEIKKDLMKMNINNNNIFYLKKINF